MQLEGDGHEQTIMYYELNEAKQWDNEGDHLYNISANKVSITNGYRVTFNFQINDGWTPSTDVDFDAWAVDKDEKEGTHKENDWNGTYDNALTIDSVKKIDLVDNDGDGYYSSVRIEADADTSVSSRTAKMILYRRDSATDGSGQAIWDTGDYTIEGTTDEFKGNDCTVTVKGTYDFAWELYDPNWYITNVWYDEASDISNVKMEPANEDIPIPHEPIFQSVPSQAKLYPYTSAPNPNPDNIGGPYEVVVDYTDPDGASDIEHVYLQLEGDGHEQTIMYYELNEAKQWDNEGDHLYNISANKVSITNGYRVTFNFQINDGWTPSTDVDFDAWAVDKDEKEGTHKENDWNGTYDNALTIDSVKKIDLVDNDGDGYYSSVRIEADADTSVSSRTAKMILYRRDSATDGSGQAIWDTGDYTIEGTTDEFKGNDCTVTVKGTYDFAWELYDPNWYITNVWYDEASDISNVKMEPSNEDLPPDHPDLEFFDDFQYESINDLHFKNIGWLVQDESNPYGPGISGSWRKERVAFIESPVREGDSVMQLTAITDGNQSGDETEQSDVGTTHRFRYGTFAVRARLSDTDIGAQYDRIVEACLFLISKYKESGEPYSECDFEYLPNGSNWDGESKYTQQLFVNSWETVQNHDWGPDDVNKREKSYAGWHTFLIHSTTSGVKYYIDNILIDSHPSEYAADTDMRIAFQVWFHSLGNQGVSRKYSMDIDWIWHGAGTELTTSQVEYLVNDLRNNSIARKDTFTQCSYDIDPGMENINASGGIGTVDVIAPGVCGWSAVSNDNWITINKGSNGQGNGSVDYSVGANTNVEPRSGSITIAEKIFSIYQDGKVTISNKPQGTLILQPGDSSEEFFVEGGDNQLYTWTVSGPIAVEPTTGNSYIFNAPSTGGFAGKYTITVADTHDVKDSFDILVPMIISPEAFVMREDSDDLPIHVKGAPSGTWFEITQFDLSSKDVTGESGYGSFQNPTQDSPDEIIPYSPDNGVIAEVTPFTVLFKADDAGLVSINLNEIESGIYRVVPVDPIDGYIEDSNGEGINGATVSIVDPKKYTEQVQTTGDGSGNNGYFTFSLPASGGTYQFIASAVGKANRTFSSEDVLDDNTIILEDAGGSYISGNVTPPGVAKVSVYYNNFEGEPVLAGSTMANETTGAYRIDFEEILDQTEFMVRASRVGFCGIVALSAGPPINNADINLISTDDPTFNTINGEINGIYEFKSSEVDIPPGAIDTDNDGDGTPDITSVTASVSTVANQNSNNTMHSGDLLYTISLVDDSGNPITTMQKPLIITMPFNLSEFQPGDFERGHFVIRHAATQNDLINGIGIKTVAPEDIISYDAVGNGIQGSVTFQVKSLSTFAVGGPSPSVISSGSSGGGGGNCFIATVAFGHRLERHVVILSLFRDKYLLGNDLGEKFVNYYYRYSPGLADYLRKHENLKALVRWALIPVTGIAFVVIHVHPLVIFLGSLSFIAGIFLIARRRKYWQV